MRRLITVFALIAALFVLMGCGTGSKGSVESARTYDLVSGNYSGDNGLLYSTADQDKINAYKATLNESLAKKDLLAEQMVTLQTELKVLTEKDPVLPEDKTQEQSDLQKMIDDHSVSITKMQGEMIDLGINKIGFAINWDEKTSKYSISDLKIETSKDHDIYKLDENGKEELDKDGNKIVIGRDFFFGENKDIQFNGELNFDPKSGDFSFSFTRGKDTELVTYAFKGHAYDPVDMKDKEGYKAVELKGSIEVSKISEEKSVVTQSGEWGVSHIIPPQGISASDNHESSEMIAGGDSVTAGVGVLHEEPKADALAQVEEPKQE